MPEFLWTELPPEIREAALRLIAQLRALPDERRALTALLRSDHALDRGATGTNLQTLANEVCRLADLLEGWRSGPLDDSTFAFDLIEPERSEEGDRP